MIFLQRAPEFEVTLLRRTLLQSNSTALDDNGPRCVYISTWCL